MAEDVFLHNTVPKSDGAEEVFETIHIIPVSETGEPVDEASIGNHKTEDTRIKKKKPGKFLFILKCLFILVAAVIFILAASYRMGYPLLYINTSSSTTLGLYLADFTPGYKYDDYVIVTKEGEMLRTPDSATVLKRVKAFPGERYIRYDDYLEVNGRRYPVTNDARLPQLKKGSYVVPEGYLLLMNDRPISYDGRYYGPVKESLVQQKVFMVFNQEAFQGVERSIHRYIYGN